jgi:hypothetical protein
MIKYKIVDWMSNHLFIDKVFDSFEEGWDFLYEQFPDEDNFDDYYVVPIENDVL